MSERSYHLSIDGPLLRRQRQLLAELVLGCPRQLFSTETKDLLEGLIGLTDAIADQAHDRYGIDCLLVPTGRAAEKPSHVPP